MFTGTVLATVSLSYLATFDWHLIWLIEYGHILKVGLVAVGVLSGAATILLQTVEHIYGGLKERRRSAVWFLFSLSLIIALLTFPWGFEGSLNDQHYVFSSSGSKKTSRYSVLVPENVSSRPD